MLLQFDQIKSDPYFSVAVVGSSKILLDEPQGEFIDSHDVVIRCNRAPIDEKYTGKRTDIRIINCHLLNDVRDDETAKGHASIFSSFDRNFIKGVRDEHIVLKTRDVFLTEKNWGTIHEVEENNKFSVVDFSSLEEVAKHSGGSEPSCGLVAIHLALSYFGRVDVFGFNMGSTDWMNHYYEEVSSYGSTHQIEREQESIQGLLDGGQINLL